MRWVQELTETGASSTVNWGDERSDARSLSAFATGWHHDAVEMGDGLVLGLRSDGGRVVVELETRDARVHFAVRDGGLGIPAAEHERIFEKFYRLDPNLSRGVGGTGLGLYISREILRRMGGRIRVDSEPGRGATFSFELPQA